MVGFRFIALLPWVVLLACGLLVVVDDRAAAEEALASWYGPGYGPDSYGPTTASGETYDAGAYTAAHKTLPFGTQLVVSYGGNSVQVTVNDRGPNVEDRQLDLSQGAAQELGLTEPGVDYVEVSYPDGSSLGTGYPNHQGGFVNPETNDQASAPSSVHEVSLGNSYAGEGGFGANHTSHVGSSITARQEVNSGVTELPNRAMQKPEFTTVPQDGVNSEVPVVQPYAIDPAFIGRQEGFRLDGYVPDPEASMSGVTIGPGVDIGQMSVADIQSLDLPDELKQKLVPYAGLTGQNAVYVLSNLPLYLTEAEANALGQVVTQNIFGGVTTRYDAAAPGRSFAELPPEAQTVIADVAYQYGPDLAQRVPAFWSDVTEGRWDSATQKLRAFGDRYPTRRNAEADLLELAIDRGDLGPYVVQSGDTISQIASRLGTSTEYLMMHNGITDPNVIYDGRPIYY